MDRQRKAVRGYIAGMAPNRAVEFVRSFDLPEEAQSIILCDVRQKSYGCDSSILSLLLGGVAAVVSNVSVTVVKL